jgi:hypothetical protein
MISKLGPHEQKTREQPMNGRSNTMSLPGHPRRNPAPRKQPYHLFRLVSAASEAKDQY